MDQPEFSEWWTKPRAISTVIYGRDRIILLDNCGGHKTTPEIKIQLENLKVIIRFHLQIRPISVSHVTFS